MQDTDKSNTPRYSVWKKGTPTTLFVGVSPGTRAADTVVSMGCLCPFQKYSHGHASSRRFAYSTVAPRLRRVSLNTFSAPNFSTAELYSASLCSGGAMASTVPPKPPPCTRQAHCGQVCLQKRSACTIASFAEPQFCKSLLLLSPESSSSYSIRCVCPL